MQENVECLHCTTYTSDSCAKRVHRFSQRLLSTMPRWQDCERTISSESIHPRQIPNGQVEAHHSRDRREKKRKKVSDTVFHSVLLISNPRIFGIANKCRTFMLISVPEYHWNEYTNRTYVARVAATHRVNKSSNGSMSPVSSWATPRSELIDCAIPLRVRCAIPMEIVRTHP